QPLAVIGVDSGGREWARLSREVLYIQPQTGARLVARADKHNVLPAGQPARGGVRRKIGVVENQRLASARRENCDRLPRALSNSERASPVGRQSVCLAFSKHHSAPIHLSQVHGPSIEPASRAELGEQQRLSVGRDIIELGTVEQREIAFSLLARWHARYA